MKKSKMLIALLTVVLLAGCAARSNTRRAVDAPKFEQFSGQVCFLNTPLPPTVKATVIGQLDGSKGGYGGMEQVLEAAANEARKSGANLVADVRTGHRLGWTSWAQPIVSGNSYRLDEGETIDCAKLGGTLR